MLPLKKGPRSEQVAAAHFERLGYTLVTTNLRLYFAEIDLLMLSPAGELVVVEVKTVRGDLAWAQLVGPDQRRRLRRVFGHLLATSPRAIRAHLAAVNQFAQVTVFEDFLSGP